MSPRKAKKHLNLPKHVKLAFRGNFYVYRTYISTKKRDLYENIDKYGYLPPVKLVPVTATRDELYKAYLAAKEQQQYQQEPDRLTLNWVNKKYKKCADYLKLSPETHKSYSFAERIFKHKIKNTNQSLGDLYPDQLTPPTIRRLLDKRLKEQQEKGNDGNSTVNRERAYLSNVIGYAISHYDSTGITHNPCKEVKPFEENIRKEYVDDKRYDIQYQFIVNNNSPAYLAVIHELNYMLASRGVEVLDLRLKHCTKIGIEVDRRKGSKTTTIEWSPRLREAYKAAIKLHQLHPIGETFLVVGKQGTKIPPSTVQSAMQRLRMKMERVGLENEFFRLHDLKRKGVSDADNQAIAGQTEQMQRRYNVKPQTFKPPA